MKRFIVLILILAILALFSLVACENADNKNNTLTTDEANDSLSESESEEPIVYNTVDIADFNLVYHDISFAPAVNVVKDAIQKKTGVELNILRDNKSAEYEIVIGNAERDIAESFLERSYLLSDKYGFIVDGKSIYLLGLTETLIKASADHFVDTYLKDGSTFFEIESRAEVFLQTDVAAYAMPAKPEGDVIRFLSNNILYQGLYADYDRAKEIFTAYSLLRPDVVALQETDSIWREKTKLLEYMGYLGLEIVLSDKRIECPLLYNTKTLKLIDSGFNSYDELAKYDAFRSYQWALFEQISTGKKFIAVSTHLIASGSVPATSSGSSLRAQSASQAARELTELSKEYDAPIIFGGDFNSDGSSSAYSLLRAKFSSARNNCNSKKNMMYATHLGAGGVVVEGDFNSAIDHVFYSKTGVKAIHFETLLAPLTYTFTDHLAVSFDFTLE